MAAQTLAAEVVEYSDAAPLQNRPVALNPVRVNPVSDALADAVIDAFVSVRVQALVDRGFVRVIV